jgi:hypothetical protein
LAKKESTIGFLNHLKSKNNLNKSVKLSSNYNSCWWELSSSPKDSKKLIFSIGGKNINSQKLNIKFNPEDYSFSLIKKVGKTNSIEEFRQLFETLYQQD